MVLPNSITSIDYAAFSGCSSLDKVNIGSGVIVINDMAFYGCSSLTEITIPDNVKIIGSQAFTNCSSLTETTIGSSVVMIGYWAFGNCSKLESVHCKAIVPPSYDSDCFEKKTYDTATLHVPQETMDAYKADRMWARFKNIKEEE